MSSIASNSEDLILNADGGSSTVKFKIDGTEKASISSAGAFTSTTIDATKLTGNLPAISGAALTGIVHNGTFTNDVTINDSSSTPTINFNENDGTQKMKIGFSTYATDEAEWRLTADKPIKFSNNNTVRLTIAAGGAITNSSGIYSAGTQTTTSAPGWNFETCNASTISCAQNTAVRIGNVTASGFIIINDTTVTGQAAVIVTGGGAVTIVGQTNALFNNSSSPGAQHIGIYNSGGYVTIKNGMSTTAGISLMTFRTRTGQ